nr:response regulator [Sulfurovaceae bacterium]
VKKSLNRIKEEEEALQVMINEIDVLTTKSRKEVFSDAENVLQDFSDKKQIYAYISVILKLLHEKELLAEEASTAKDLFLANMSHEIRTPLNGIVGFTQLLKESSLTPDQQEFITIIENSSDNLLAIVSDILDLSKISANKMELESISFDIFEKVESAVETFVAKADEKRIELGVFIDPNIPQYLISDPTKLSQVLINLISNAIKFTPLDGSINLITEYIDDGGDNVTLRFAVKDSGIGVNEEQKTKIFQAFTQADSSTSREFGGTGLGLTISYTIIQYMDGVLDVLSTPGEGAEFFFTIKLEKDKSSKEVIYPTYKGLNIGLALPDKSMDRQVDKNLQTYIEMVRARFSIYSYDELLNGNQATILPDILFIDHYFAKRAQEINMFSKLKTHIILMTTGNLKRIIDAQNHSFLNIIHKPMTMSKTIRLIKEYSSGEVATVESDHDILETDEFQHINALVAEDNLINQKLILVTLEKFGVEVTLASNGKEALEHRKHEVYDIIFMDIQMPVMNGMEATKAILEYEKEENLDHIPIIALTANALKGDREKYIEAGMDGYASKPLNLQEIKKIIGDYFPNDGEESSLTPSNKITPPVASNDNDNDNDNNEDEYEDEYEEYEEEDYDDEVVEKEFDIILYNEMSLQSQVYSRIFKGLGYDVEVVEDDDTFLDKIESGIYIYALYDSTCFDNRPCMVADIARDADTVPLVFVNEEQKEDFCADTLERNLDSSSLKEKLESAT